MAQPRKIETKVNVPGEQEITPEEKDEAILKACNKVYFGNHDDATYDVYRVNGELHVTIDVSVNQ